MIGVMNLAEIAASELNHHIAGIALIVIALFAILGVTSRWQAARFVWPSLLIGLGIFLAAWSDAEIWPRGTLGWSWLLSHDLEARQHKIYAFLLLAIGLTELLRVRGSLPKNWQRWSFPALAVCGALLLTMHAHSGTSGLPQPVRPSHSLAMVAEVTPSAGIDLQMAGMHHVHSDTAPPADHEVPATKEPHRHVMDASMVKVQQQHIWMAVIGVALALFKFLADSQIGRRVTQIAWPAAMASLGLLLVLYRE